MHVSKENQIKDFRSYLLQLGYSKSSCYMLPDCVQDFLRQNNNANTKELNTEHIQVFYEYLHIRPNKNKAGGLSERYISHHVYALKLFFNWQEVIGEISFNPMSVMKFKKPQGNPREPLTQNEISELFEAAESLKEKALLHICYSCGLRRSEAEALNIQDIHFRKQMLYVRDGKGAKRRAVPMSARVTRELEDYYLQERTARTNANSATNVISTTAFILNSRGGRMSGDNYNRILKGILSRTEIQKEISLHHLRHSIATHLLESGLEIEKVRDFLGHGFLETTQIYVKVNQHQLNAL
jgi:integrase/recombinase XerD